VAARPLPSTWAGGGRGASEVYDSSEGTSQERANPAGVTTSLSRQLSGGFFLLLVVFGGATSVDAQPTRDMAHRRDELGVKVQAALARVSRALADAGALDLGTATTAQLLAMQNELQTARVEFNDVDHAFKGQPNTGLSLDQVAPSLAVLNLDQLRIQDELQRRGVPTAQIAGYRTALDWLGSVAPDADAHFRELYGRSTRSARIDSVVASNALNIANGLVTAQQLAETVSYDVGVMPDISYFRDLAPAFYATLANPPAGGIEAALARVLAIYGYTSPLPRFGDRKPSGVP